jgi:hypothetical protein
MSLGAARVVAALLEGYALAGLVFAVLFLPRGIVRVDPLVGHSAWRVRLLFVPGVVALWPVMAMRWRRATARLGSTNQASSTAEDRP